LPVNGIEQSQTLQRNTLLTFDHCSVLCKADSKNIH